MLLKKERWYGLKVILNGKEEQVEAGTTVYGLVKLKGFNPDTVIVEFNNELVKQENWDVTVLKNGDRLEILRFVGGG